jgi:hypothetical protein
MGQADQEDREADRQHRATQNTPQRHCETGFVQDGFLPGKVGDTERGMH